MKERPPTRQKGYVRISAAGVFLRSLRPVQQHPRLAHPLLLGTTMGQADLSESGVTMHPKVMFFRKTSLIGLLLGLGAACTSEERPNEEPLVPDVPSEPEPGIRVAGVSVPEGLEVLSQEAEAARQATPAALREATSSTFATDLGYDPLTAEGLEPILEGIVWDESVASAARVQLSEQGFAMPWDRQFSSFASGYSEIYMQDLPVYITADMVLEAIHRSYSKILQAVEKQKLISSLEAVLEKTRARLAERQETLDAATASDLNFYLGVAESLLSGNVASNEPSGVAEFVAAAEAAQGIERRVLFGVERLIDFSQFTPRGHYAGDAQFERYFRAMMWLGRIDFRMLETTPDGEQVLRRPQVQAALGLRDLVLEAASEEYAVIDDTITAFVGEHDYLTVDDLGVFLEGLGGAEALAERSDGELAQALVDAELPPQRIASSVMVRAPGGGTYPLNVSFALFGQRYTVDSHVLSNVVYDRLPTRVVPDALDVAYGALKNDQAIALMGDELDSEAGLSGALSSTRFLVDQHPEEYWQGSLYTSWMGGLRALSAPAGGPAEDLPTVAKTEAWGRRLLNTQLASWAELRHNNVLYVKQSYTSSALCEYPDAYVDPYPEFFEAVVRHAELGQTLVASLGLGEEMGERIADYFEALAQSAAILGQMAEHQRTGTAHSEEHLAFINQAVTVDVNCDGTILGHTGWYADMHFEALEAVKQDPIITDVHTDIGGDLPVARPASVLHVGNHLPRPLIVTVDTCSGPRAYVGVASVFQQKLVEGTNRMTDQEWSSAIYETDETPAWLKPVLGR